MFDKKVPEAGEVFHVKSYSGSVLKVFNDRVVITQEGAFLMPEIRKDE